MKILIAVDSFKGTLTSIQASKIIKKVFESKGHSVEIVPIADGGEGTLEAINYSIRGEKKYVSVSNPLAKKIISYYIIKNKTAYLEFAKSSGLILLKKSGLNPLKASSYGFGELINSALKENINNIVMGIGGSATNDAGVGMLSALGVKFYGKNMNEIKHLDKTGGEILNQIIDIDISGLNPKIRKINFTVFNDVKNPLFGKNGATKVYAPQKGANKNDIKKLEKGIRHFAKIIEKTFNANPQFEGAGSAGGLGFALKIFLNAKIIHGIEGIINLVGIKEKIEKSDLIITGEGAIDYQSSFGKAPMGIAKLAKKYDKKVIAVCGKTGKNAKELFKYGIDFIFSYYGDEKVSSSFLKQNAKMNLIKTAEYAAEKINNYEKLKNKIYIVKET